MNRQISQHINRIAHLQGLIRERDSRAELRHTIEAMQQAGVRDEKVLAGLMRMQAEYQQILGNTERSAA